MLAEIVPAIIRSFPWPKSMRWGAASAKPGALRWVRPLQSILCTFGPETETPEVVPFEVDGIARRRRHPRPSLHGAGPHPRAPLRRLRGGAGEGAKVVLDADRRKDIILADARDLAFARGLELVEDEALLEEVAGLVEWPVVLMGAFDEAFLDIPPEVIRATIRANQKCFVLRDPATGALANHFVLVVQHRGERRRRPRSSAGNERVVRARLSDARHFWETDQRDLPDYADAAPTSRSTSASPS